MSAKIEESTDEIVREMWTKIVKEMETDKRPKAFAEEVADWARTREAPSPIYHHPLTKTGPYATGAFAASIKVRQSRNAKGQFLPTFEIYSLSPIANLLEYGTGDDAEGTHSPWGRLTPTPEFAVFARTAHHFRGTYP